MIGFIHSICYRGHDVDLIFIQECHSKIYSLALHPRSLQRFKERLHLSGIVLVVSAAYRKVTAAADRCGLLGDAGDYPFPVKIH